MPNSIAFTKTYIPIIDEVYQNASVSRVLTSSGRIVRSTHNAREIMIPMVTGVANKLSLAHDYAIREWEAAGLDRPSIARLDRIA